MRCHLRKNAVLAVLLLAGGLYFISHSSVLVAGPARSSEHTPNELSWQAERLVTKESWVDQGDYLPLNVSYQLLAGAPSFQQNSDSPTGLKRNYNDSPQRVSFRSKQNMDYSFLIHYSASLAQYYLQLEDDVSSAKNFLTTIRRHVKGQEAKKITWAMLEFSSLGYIGKLYKSVHLPLLVRFLFLFYQEMPCDWLMSHFRELLTQKERILLKPSLFQHVGTFSSFEGTYNKLKDKDFEEEFYNNPAAEVYSDMSAYKNHVPKHAWEAGEEFFWGRALEKDNYLTVVLAVPAVVTEIFVETGSEGKDLLESAQVELGHDVVTIKNGEKNCTDLQSVGTVVNGRFEMHEVNKKYNSASSCLRIQVTAAQKDWVIIKKIRIATKLSTPQQQAGV
nr:PREDICTED: alpha-1,3-mannosyl-glycoprotein 4-beta-N-acetylglucosaminyltransferase C-like [Paralichthys olivaceus]